MKLIPALVITATLAASGLLARADVVTSVGTISEFSPSSMVIRTETASAPTTYVVSKDVTYVDEAGAPVSMEVVRSGAPVSVQYVTEGGRAVVRKVTVRRTTTTTAPAAGVVTERRAVVVEPAAPAVIERRTTTTTTTTTRKGND